MYLSVQCSILTATATEKTRNIIFKFPRDGGSCQPNRKNIFYTAGRRQHTGDDKNRGPPAVLHRKAKGFVDVIVIWATSSHDAPIGSGRSENLAKNSLNHTFRSGTLLFLLFWLEDGESPIIAKTGLAKFFMEIIIERNFPSR